MTFLQTLHANLGELIRLKSQLWWYDTQLWDNKHDRVCLILDASLATGAIEESFSARSVHAYFPEKRCAIKLLMDGSPHWIWIDEKDVELLTSEPA